MFEERSNSGNKKVLCSKDYREGRMKIGRRDTERNKKRNKEDKRRMERSRKRR